MKELVVVSFEYEIEYNTPEGRMLAIEKAGGGAIDSTTWIKNDTVRVKRIRHVENEEGM